MKIVSMQIEGADRPGVIGNKNRAGIVIGDEVLDVTGCISGTRAGDEIDEIRYHAEQAARDWDEEPSGLESGAYPIVVFPIADAIGVLNYGLDFVQRFVGDITNQPEEAEAYRRKGILLPLASVKLNPPVLAPGKILAVGLNYAAHAAEQNIKPPETPLIFSKNVTALIAPNQPIQLPYASDQVDYEAELAFVIGKEARSVSAERAFDYIAGYTIINDVTARDLQAREKQWVRAKGLDTFAPCGPWLVTLDEISDPHALDIELRVNGELRQQSNTSDLIFKIPQLVEFISQDLTLRPGDIISTGTPSGVGVFMNPPVYLKDGDQIDITLAGVGELRNPVKGRAAR